MKLGTQIVPPAESSRDAIATGDPNEFKKNQRSHIVSLTDAANVSISAIDSNTYELVATAGVGATRQLDNPTNLIKGMAFQVWFQQDGIGGRALTFDTFYDFGDEPTPDFTGDAANEVSIITCVATSATTIAATLGSGGVNLSLDGAYNGGPSITVDSGAVTLEAAVADASNALDILRGPTSGPVAAGGIDVIMGVNTSGHAYAANLGGTGRGLSLAMNSAGGEGIVITRNVASSTNSLRITHNVTGTTGTMISLVKSPAASTAGAMINFSAGANCTGNPIVIANDGSGNSIDINHSGSGVGVSVDQDAVTSGVGIAVAANVADSTSDCISVNKSPPGGGGAVGDALAITMGANALGRGVDVSNSGSGEGVYVTQSSAGDAYYANVAHASARGMVLVDTTDLTNEILVIQLNQDGAGGGININKSPATGAAGDAVDITMGANATGSGISIANSGTGHGLNFTGSDTTPTRSDILFALATADPSSLADGSFWYNTTDDALKYHNGTAVRTLASLQEEQQYTAAQYSHVTTLTDAAVTLIDASAGNVFELTATVGVGATRQLDNPTNLVKGMTWIVIYNQDGIGSRALTFDTFYDFGDEGAPDLSTDAANETTIISCVALSTTQIACSALLGFA